MAIDCLPRETRIAMLDGIRANPIIVGAYSRDGGICPMLAAHRSGGRTNLISFAKAWDRFAFRGDRAQHARRATERELLVLRTHLEASLLEDEYPACDFAAAVAEHRALQARTPTAVEPEHRSNTRTGDPDRARELRGRPGWRWMRVVRSLDDYERTLRALAAAAPEDTPAAPEDAPAAHTPTLARDREPARN